jgi:hypothetical protein
MNQYRFAKLVCAVAILKIDFVDVEVVYVAHDKEQSRAAEGQQD